MRRERERAGAGFVAARGVGDLDMRDAGGVVGDHLVDVVAVDGEVVEVGQQAELSTSAGAVDRGERVGGGEQRVGGRR